MRAVVELILKRYLLKLKATTFYRWHTDYMSQKEHVNGEVIILIVVSLTAGKTLSLPYIIFMAVTLYLADLWRFTIQNHDDIDYLQLEQDWNERWDKEEEQ